MSDFPLADDVDMWEGDDLDGPPPLLIRKGRRSRFKFAMTPQWVLLMTELPHPAFRLYCLMLAHANAERGDGRVWPFQETLAELMGYSRRASVDPLVKILQKLGLVDVEEVRYGQNNSRRRNIYTVHEEPPDGWEGLASLQEFYALKKAAAEAERKIAEASGSDGTEDNPGSASADSAAAAGSGEAPAAGGGGGSAATSKAPGKSSGSKPAPKGKGKGGKRLTRDQAAALRAVEEAWPAELQALLPKYRPQVLRDAILQALESRSADQLVVRVKSRWWAHGYAADAMPGRKGIGSPVGVAVGLVRPSTDCREPMCEDGTVLDTGETCRSCAERRAERRAKRRSGGGVPAQRVERHGDDARRWWECAECRDPRRGDRPEDGLCPGCRADAEEAAAAARRLAEECAEAEAERGRRAAGAWDVMLEDAYAEHVRRDQEARERRARQEEQERRRREEQEETQRLREQIAREHPELAAFAQKT